MAIKYIINLMLENRSYDQVLGYRDPNIGTYVNYFEGKSYSPSQIPYFNGEGYGRFSHEATMYSINTPAEHEISPNKGFVYANKVYQYSPVINNPNPPEDTMGYFPPVPIYEFLIDNYVLCDNYFSSVPGQTDPNRFFSLSATSLGQVNDYLFSFDSNTMVPQTQPTIITKLLEAGHQAKVYANSYTPESLLLLSHMNHVEVFASLNQFFEDVKNQALPFFSYIEPAYERINISGRNTDQYEFELVTTIYNVLKQHPEIWNHCVFILNFDEHGGYHDHVHPPETVAPDDHTSLFSFQQYGVRVPCLIISPFVDHKVDSGIYDHCSVLATIEKLVNIGPLTNRDSKANDFLHLFNPSIRETPNYSSFIHSFPLPPVNMVNLLEYIAVFAYISWRLVGSGDAKEGMTTVMKLRNFEGEQFMAATKFEIELWVSKMKKKKSTKNRQPATIDKETIICGLLSYFDQNEELSKYKYLLKKLF